MLIKNGKNIQYAPKNNFSLFVTPSLSTGYNTMFIGKRRVGGGQSLGDMSLKADFFTPFLIFCLGRSSSVEMESSTEAVAKLQTGGIGEDMFV